MVGIAIACHITWELWLRERGSGECHGCRQTASEEQPQMRAAGQLAYRFRVRGAASDCLMATGAQWPRYCRGSNSACHALRMRWNSDASVSCRSRCEVVAGRASLLTTREFRSGSLAITNALQCAGPSSIASILTIRIINKTRLILSNTSKIPSSDGRGRAHDGIAWVAACRSRWHGLSQ